MRRSRGVRSVPQLSAASGIWGINEAYESRLDKIWPTSEIGQTPYDAATSAADIKSNNSSATDGVYWIDLPSSGPTQIYCVMNSAWDGGAWMLAMKATRGTTFQYSSNYWTTNNTLNPSDVNLNDGDAKYAVFNEFEGDDIAARFPDVSSGGTLGSNLGGWTWNENNRLLSRSLSTFFANTATNTYLLQDGSVPSWTGFASGPFTGQSGWRKYGFNLNDGTRQSRWGFLWNNETTPGSNDVDGGVGMGSRPNYSAGDYVTCCAAHNNGVNRSMRMEIYVR
jgi:hypothetical protein